MILKIAYKELRLLFCSPLAWTILAVTQAIIAYFFLIYLENYLQIQPSLMSMTNPPGVSTMVVGPLFATTAVVMLLIVPMITMRLISEERKSGSMTLLTSAPLSITEIVLGKFTGAMSFLTIMLLLICLMPLSLLFIGNLDFGILLSGVLGLLLLLSGITSVGLYMSSMTRQPAIAAVSTFGILLLLWIVDLAGSGEISSSAVAYLSMLNHYQNLLRGIFTSTDVIYYLLVSAVFVVLTIRRLDAQRLQQ